MTPTGMESAPQRFVVFSSVGSFGLDVDAGNGALNAVEVLRSRNVPLVLCAGRTRAELEYLQQQIGVTDPFISEHGAAVFVPHGYFPDELLNGSRRRGEYAVLEFGRPYSHVVAAVHRAAARARASIVNFSGMSIADVATACNTSLLKARLAKLRDYEEAFLVLDDDREARARVWRQLQSAQLACIHEGRFDYAGRAVDLGVGAQWLIALYRRAFGPVLTIGVGDQPHHAPLLRRVDIPIVVPRDDFSQDLVSAVPRAAVAIDASRAGLSDLLATILGRHSWIPAS